MIARQLAHTVKLEPLPVMASTMLPQTRYARSGDVNIAFQVVGDGPVDLVYVPGWVSNVEYGWEEPSLRRFLDRLSSFSRLILFDKRGTGLSDRVAELPTLEQRMDDVRAVMDAVGSRSAALFGTSEGGPMCALFAATYPARTAALVMYGAYAKRRWAPDYPWAPTPEERQLFYNAIEQDWGGIVDLTALAPSRLADERFCQWWAAFLRRSASPGAALALARMNTEIDVRPILPAIHVPTLILHRSDDGDSPVEGSRYLAKRIPGASFVELPGVDHLSFVGDADAILDEIQLFLTGERPPIELDRVVTTIMVTDIVGSTERAISLGDRRWRELLAAHDMAVRQEVGRHRGVEQATTGDGFLATFDGPARAIRCARAIREAVQRVGIDLRIGLHTGECHIQEGDVGGIALHIGSRVADLARTNEVLVSSTVKDLVAGSGIGFEERGRHTLKGVPGVWRLYAVS